MNFQMKAEEKEWQSKAAPHSGERCGLQFQQDGWRALWRWFETDRHVSIGISRREGWLVAVYISFQIIQINLNWHLQQDALPSSETGCFACCPLRGSALQSIHSLIFWEKSAHSTGHPMTLEPSPEGSYQSTASKALWNLGWYLSSSYIMVSIDRDCHVTAVDH